MPASSDVTLKADLHARPAGQLSVAAAGFQCSIRLSAGGREADAKSVLGVMQLGASAGVTVTVTADGPDETPAVDTLTALLAAVTPADLSPDPQRRTERAVTTLPGRLCRLGG